MSTRKFYALFALVVALVSIVLAMVSNRSMPTVQAETVEDARYMPTQAHVDNTRDGQLSVVGVVMTANMPVVGRSNGCVLYVHSMVAHVETDGFSASTYLYHGTDCKATPVVKHTNNNVPTVTTTTVPPVVVPPTTTPEPPVVVVPPAEPPSQPPVVVPPTDTPKDNCNNGAGNGNNCTPGHSSGSNQGQGQKTGDQTNQGEQGNK